MLKRKKIKLLKNKKEVPTKMNFVKKRNISIQLIRVMAMTMILCDHILMHVSFSMKSIVIQITNSGVLIFLFISGYLYGNKHVNKWMEWFKNRVIRICIPMWIFMVIDFIVSAVVWNVFNLKNVFIYIFNLQGILAADTRGGTTLVSYSDYDLLYNNPFVAMD